MASWYRKEDSAPYETAELIISGIIPIFLIVVGTIGNVVSIIILMNKENRRYSTNIYLTFLCVMDTISLYQWNLNSAMFTLTKGQAQVWTKSVIICKLSQFFGFYTLHTSAMFLTLVEMDRACLLRSAWYKQKIARARVALAICLCILAILFALNGFLFVIGFEIPIYDTVTGQLQQVIVACYYTLDAPLMSFYANQYPWLHLVVMYFVPFTVMILCTLFTMKKLCIRATFANEQLALSNQRNRRISIMLLLMCLTYVIATLPNRLCFSVFADQLVGHDYTDTVFLSTSVFIYTRSSINAFFLYLSVHGYRRSLRSMVLRCLGKRSVQVGVSNTATAYRGQGNSSITVQTVRAN